MTKNSNKYFKLLGIVFCSFFMMINSAHAADVFGMIQEKVLDALIGTQGLVIILAGFGLVTISAAAIFGKMSWKRFANLAVSLTIIAASGALVDYFVSKDGKNGQKYKLAYGDTLNPQDPSYTGNFQSWSGEGGTTGFESYQGDATPFGSWQGEAGGFESWSGADATTGFESWSGSDSGASMELMGPYGGVFDPSAVGLDMNMPGLNGSGDGGEEVDTRTFWEKVKDTYDRGLDVYDSGMEAYDAALAAKNMANMSWNTFGDLDFSDIDSIGGFVDFVGDLGRGVGQAGRAVDNYYNARGDLADAGLGSGENVDNNQGFFRNLFNSISNTGSKVQTTGGQVDGRVKGAENRKKTASDDWSWN